MKKILLSLVAAATLCVPAMAQNRVKNIWASQGELDCAKVMNTAETVQVNRYLFAGYNTLCLPMTFGAEQMQAAAEGLRLERLVGIGQESSTLVLYFLDCTQEGLQAGTPYLVFAPKAQYLRLKNTDAQYLSDALQHVRLSDQTGNTVDFGSSWQTIAQDGLYGIPAKQDVPVLESILIRTTTDKAFLPTRCGINWEQQATGISDIAIRHIKSLDKATGLSAVVNDRASNGQWQYDLSGRKASGAKRSIVIENGKKVLK